LTQQQHLEAPRYEQRYLSRPARTAQFQCGAAGASAVAAARYPPAKATAHQQRQRWSAFGRDLAREYTTDIFAADPANPPYNPFIGNAQAGRVRAFCVIKVGGVDITDRIMPYLLSVRIIHRPLLTAEIEIDDRMGSCRSRPSRRRSSRLHLWHRPSGAAVSSSSKCIVPTNIGALMLAAVALVTAVLAWCWRYTDMAIQYHPVRTVAERVSCCGASRYQRIVRQFVAANIERLVTSCADGLAFRKRWCASQ
jgi:hypothetical protein